MLGAISNDARHCLDLVRAADKDRFLAALFAPQEGRRRLNALYAFNIELSRVRQAVSDPQLGEIRFTWWHDVIVAIYGGEVLAHPVVVELARAIEAADLPQASLINMIEARRSDLYDDPMPSLNDLEGYLGETASALIQVAAWALAGKEATAAAAAAGYAGVAQGLTGLLRSLPLHRARGQCLVPGDVLARHGLTPAHVLAGRFDTAMQKAIGELADHSRARIAQARALRGEVPGAALPAFLAAGMSDLYLRKLQRKGFDPLSEVADVSQIRRQMQLWRKAYTGDF